MSEISAIAGRLLTLVRPKLTLEEQNTLGLIVTRLFNDLDLGHSCSEFCNDEYKLNTEQITILLLKSELAIEYSSLPTMLRPVPISILHMNGRTLVYITKYLQYELNILNKVKSLVAAKSSHVPMALDLLDQLSKCSEIPNLEQMSAIKNLVANKFSIITGGPGTGKTTTIAILLWLFYKIYGADLKVKICAPTGKAANRVLESIGHTILNPKLDQLDFSDVDALLKTNNSFLTIHKLLGYQSNSIYFRHDKNQPLDIDILIIDESSMVSLPLFSKLLMAVNDNTIKHLILLGDKNQLSSVEEGYVFASLVNADDLKQNVSYLQKSNRNSQDVGELALAIHDQDLVKFNSLINSKENIKLYKAKLSELFERQLFAKSKYSLRNYFEYIATADLSDVQLLFKQFNYQSTLCLTNVGILGTYYINSEIEKRVKYLLSSKVDTYDLFSDTKKSENVAMAYNEWYTGRPIIILENDYNLNLFNGDIGICIVRDYKAEIVFAGDYRVIPELLPKYQLAYAITVHKAQGSEYEHVNLVLCNDSGMENMENFIRRELLYTGVTRAKKSVSIFSGMRVLAHAISNRTVRNTGLDLQSNYLL